MTIKYALIFSRTMHQPKYIVAKSFIEFKELFERELLFAMGRQLGELELMYRVY